MFVFTLLFDRSSKRQSGFDIALPAVSSIDAGGAIPGLSVFFHVSVADSFTVIGN